MSCSRLSQILGPGTSRSHKQPSPLACHSQRPGITRAIYTSVVTRSVSERYLDRPSRAFQLSNLFSFTFFGQALHTYTYVATNSHWPFTPPSFLSNFDVPREQALAAAAASTSTLAFRIHAYEWNLPEQSPSIATIASPSSPAAPSATSDGL